MPPRRKPTGRPSIKKATAINSALMAWLRRYLQWMEVKGFSDRSIEWREVSVRLFIEWCAARSINDPQEVTRPIIERYQRHLFHYRVEKTGKPLSFRTQAGRLMQLKQFFRWLSKQNVILYNPAADIELPKLPHNLPPQVLTHQEVERIMNQPDTRELLGIRDRAILETFYSTGIRRKELASLSVFDLDRERRTVLVRKGKGNRQRVVPVGERALMWITKYLDDVRPQLVIEPDDGSLFVSHFGEAFTLSRLSQIVRGHIADSGVGKSGASHALRHAMATAMLEGGADIRFIQSMLGHQDLATTQIYTHVSIRQLQRVHAMSHPTATMGPKSPRAEGDVEGVHVIAKGDDREELEAMLIAEAAEEDDQG